MKDKGDMIDRRQLIRELYEDELSVGRAERTDALDPDARRELESMKEMKGLLDARPRQRPNAGTIGAVLAAARGEAVPHRIDTNAAEVTTSAPEVTTRGSRKDRPPVHRRKYVSLRVGATSAVVILLIAFAGILNMDVFDASTPVVVNDSDGRAASERGLAGSPQSTPPDAPDDAGVVAGGESEEFADAELVSRNPSGSTSRVAPPDQVVRRDSSPDAGMGDALKEFHELESGALAWDHRVDVIQVYQDIERLGGGVQQGWEPPAIPLEMMPQQDRYGRDFLHPAGQAQQP